MTVRKTSRRTVLAAAGSAGLAATVAACGGSDGGGGYGGDGGKDTGKETPTEDGDAGGGQELGSVTDIPEGGGKVFKEQKVVVTRPSGTDVKAFSAVCTHKGCAVAQVADGTINCACHGSKFSIEDGSVQNGPAQKPLPGAKVSVKGGKLSLDS